MRKEGLQNLTFRVSPKAKEARKSSKSPNWQFEQMDEGKRNRNEKKGMKGASIAENNKI